MHNARRTKSNLFLLLCILLSAFCIAACGIPNLESQSCSKARDAAKQFYSFHFGNDMKPTKENITARRRFLTPELFAKLSSGRDDGHDYFTNSDDYPRTFKIGACRENNPSDTDFNLDIYWRDDKKTVQNELLLTLLKTEDGWLIDRVTPNKP